MENGPFEDVFPIKDRDIPANCVSLPEGNSYCQVPYTLKIGTLLDSNNGGCQVNIANLPLVGDWPETQCSSHLLVVTCIVGGIHQRFLGGACCDDQESAVECAAKLVGAVVGFRMPIFRKNIQGAWNSFNKKLPSLKREKFRLSPFELKGVIFVEQKLWFICAMVSIFFASLVLGVLKHNHITLGVDNLWIGFDTLVDLVGSFWPCIKKVLWTAKTFKGLTKIHTYTCFSFGGRETKVLTSHSFLFFLCRQSN